MLIRGAHVLRGRFLASGAFARDALLCLVTVRGTFIPDLPPGVKPTGTPDPDAVLYQIHDA
jgi:hypothetical protein